MAQCKGTSSHDEEQLSRTIKKTKTVRSLKETLKGKDTRDDFVEILPFKPHEKKLYC